MDEEDGIDGPERLSEGETDQLGAALESALGSGFAGYEVRVDAGEAGRLWVSLAGAAGDADARRVTAERLREELAREAPLEREFVCRISTTPSAGDLLFLCDLFASAAGSP